MGNDIFYTGKLDDHEMQRQVVEFAKGYYKDYIIIDQTVNALEKPVELYGIVHGKSLGGKKGMIEECEQILFDRANDNKLVSLSSNQQGVQLSVESLFEDIEHGRIMEQNGGYSRIFGGAAFEILLILINNRYIGDLKYISDYLQVPYPLPENDDEARSIYNKLLAQETSYDECLAIMMQLQEDWLSRSSPVTKELSDFLPSLPEKFVHPSDILLSDINFSTKTQKKLASGKLHTLEDVFTLSEIELLQQKRIGRSALIEIMTFRKLWSDPGSIAPSS